LRKRLLLVPCVFVVFAVMLTACGSSSDETGEVEDVIVASATADKPVNCTKLNTLRFNEQVAGESGEAAVEECEEEAEKEEGLDSVRVSEVEIDDSDATAMVAMSGGGFDGQAIEVALVKNGDQWKLDEIVKFTKFDPKQLAKAFEEEVAEHPGELSNSLADCIAGAFAASSREEAEELLLSGSSKALEDVVEGCATRPSA
jgi:hypothetical protein